MNGVAGTLKAETEKNVYSTVAMRVCNLSSRKTFCITNTSEKVKM